MKVAWKKNVAFVIIGIAGVGYGVLTELFAIPDGVHFGLIMILLCLIAFSVLQKNMLIQEHKKNKFQSFITSHESFHGDLLSKLVDELDKAIQIEGDNLVVEHRFLAISSYDNFWKLLVNYKRQNRDKILSVQAIHSCDMDIWMNHSLTDELLRRQKQFIQYKGKIRRILCGRGSVPSRTIQEAAQNMAEAGIEVYYYDLQTGRVNDYTFSWDFLRIEETDHAVIWASFASIPNGVIEKAVYCRTKYDDHELAPLWSDIHAHSKPFPFAASL